MQYAFRTILVPLAVSALAFFSVSVPSALAANWYVDNSVASSGNGISWSSAWKNFSNISWASINAGDTVYISGGSSSQTYNETLTVGKSGSSSSPITISKGVDTGHNGTVVIDGQNSRIGVVLSGIDNITIQNLNVQNGNDTAFSVKSASSGVLLQYNTVMAGNVANGNARGYDVRSSSGVTVRANSFDTPSSTTAQTDGVWTSSNNGVVFDGNTIYVSNNDGTGHSDCFQSYLDTAVTIRNNFCWQKNSGNNNHGMWLSDILEYRLTGDENVFYLYNPFDDVVLGHFLDNVGASLKSKPRQIWLLYHIPEHADIIQKHNIFTRSQEYSVGGTEFIVYMAE